MRNPVSWVTLAALSLAAFSCSSSPRPGSKPADTTKSEAKMQAPPEDLSQYRFYAVPVPQGVLSDSLLAYGLWKEPPSARDGLKLAPDTEYLLGVERDATPADSALTDLSFTDPKGLIVQTTTLKKVFTRESGVLYHYGVFFPADQADVVWDGIVRWVWQEGVRIVPQAGSKTSSFGSYPAKNEAFTQSLTPPIVRGSEIEVQVVAQNHQVTKVRKVFRVAGKALPDVRFGLQKMNERKEEQFPSRFTEVTAAERANPDIQITVRAGSAVTKPIPVTHAASIASTFMSCATRHSAPPFLAMDVSLDGWNGPKVKLSANVRAADNAPKGDHYFRVVHRASWDRGTLYKERIAKVSIE